MKLRFWFLVLIFSLNCTFSQNPPPLEFEVASVKVSPVPAVHRAFTLNEHGVDFGNITMETVVETAYNLPPHQIRGLSWFQDSRYEIEAKAPAGSTKAQVQDMLKSVLIQRFQMKSHMDAKDAEVYVLGVGKGGAKIPVAAEEPSLPDLNHKQVLQRIVAPSGPQYIFREPGRMVFEAKKITMPEFTRFLLSYVDFPIIDQTGLRDSYEISLDVPGGTNYKHRPATVEPLPQADAIGDPAGDVSVLSSIRKLGLVLDKRRAPLPILVVDSMNRTPTDN